MLPNPSWLPWCFALGLVLLSAACSRKSPRGEGEDPVEADAEAATEDEFDADVEERQQSVDAAADLRDATVAARGAEQPGSADSATFDAATTSDTGDKKAEDAAASDSAARDSGSGDATPLAADAQGDACLSTKAEAGSQGAAPIDFVWIIDSSASMFDEQTRLRSALNAFVERVEQSKLDVRVIMVSRTPQLVAGPVQVPGLCPEFPPDPLYNHPFAQDPRYHFLQTSVDSSTLLNVAINNYPRYAGFLRAGSAVHFLAATDDEDAYPRGAAQFVTSMNALLGRSFHFHVFASPGPTPCAASECAPDVDAGVCAFISIDCRAANVGAVYYQLASLTNGVTASICDSDWRPGLQAIFERAAISPTANCL